MFNFLHWHKISGKFINAYFDRKMTAALISELRIATTGSNLSNCSFFRVFSILIRHIRMLWNLSTVKFFTGLYSHTFLNSAYHSSHYATDATDVHRINMYMCIAPMVFQR